jgi:RecJ-like exonuclease
MKVQCTDCKGTGRIQNSRCSKCNGYRNIEIEPAEWLRQNRARVSRNLPKLVRV